MISAREARQLCPVSLDECLIRLDTQIKKAASNGETYIRVPYDMTKVEGCCVFFTLHELRQKLKDLGYTIKEKYEERQFVDIYLEIHWGE